MPIPLTQLDDRRFDDLVNEVRALIPRYAPVWTDHNASDPGITLIELFAWVTETLFYRANRAQDSSEARLLALLGAVFEPARPARVSLKVEASGIDESFYIAHGALLTATPGDGGRPVKFETVGDLRFAEVPSQTGLFRGRIQAQQIVQVADELLGESNGQPFQRLTLAAPFVCIDDAALNPIVPQVTVDAEPWSYRCSLLTSGADDRHFTVDPHTSAVCFGNGHPGADGDSTGMGKIPPALAQIKASYYSTLGALGNIHPDSSMVFDDYSQISLQVTLDEETPEGIVMGADPTSLNQARAQAVGALRTPYRAITAEDFEHLVLGEPDFALARAKCLPGLDLTRADPEQIAMEDHVSVIVVPQTSSMESAVFSPNGLRALTASSDQKTRIWDPDTEKVLCVMGGHGAAVLSAAYSTNGARIVTASEDATARLWNAANGDELQVLAGHREAVTSAAFSPNGAFIVTASDDNTARVWDADGDERQALTGHDDSVLRAAYSPDGKRIVTAAADATVRVWDANTGEALQLLTGHGAAVTSAAYAPDGACIVTASEDGKARVWDAVTGAILQVLSGHSAGVMSAAYAPDGRRIVTASRDGTARVWEAADGHPLRVVTGYTAAMRSAVFSPDGARVITASKDGTARVWDINHGEPLNRLSIEDDRPTPTKGDMSEVFEFLDGRRLITCRHHVMGPRYTDVWLAVEVITRGRVPTSDVSITIEEKLVDFFDPISGGPTADGQGWPFGRGVYASEVYQLIEGIDGVDHVSRFVLNPTHNTSNSDHAIECIEIPERNLIHFDKDRSRIKVRGPA